MKCIEAISENDATAGGQKYNKENILTARVAHLREKACYISIKEIAVTSQCQRNQYY